MDVRVIECKRGACTDNSCGTIDIIEAVDRDPVGEGQSTIKGNTKIVDGTSKEQIKEAVKEGVKAGIGAVPKSMLPGFGESTKSMLPAIDTGEFSEQYVVVADLDQRVRQLERKARANRPRRNEEV